MRRAGEGVVDAERGHEGVMIGVIGRLQSKKAGLGRTGIAGLPV